MKNKNILVLDTETLNLLDRSIYNLGFIIQLNNGKTIKKDYLITDLFNEIKHNLTSWYYKDKLPIYEQLLDTKNITPIKWVDAIRQLKRYMTIYQINDLYAFNSRFDIGAIDYTNNLMLEKELKLDIIDILEIARNKLAHNENYKKFCEKYSYMTKHKTPQCKMNVETIIKYLHNDLDFKEQHTALSDSINELEILNYLEQLS